MRFIYFLFLFLFFISFTTALSLSGGEEITFNLGEEFEYYDVVGNSTSLEGITIISNGTNITIKADLLIEPDSFTLIFFNEKEVVKEVSVGGGGGGTRIVREKEYVEIPNYVDREVEVEVEKRVEDTEEIERLRKENNKIFWTSLITILFLVMASSIIICQKKKQIKKLKKQIGEEINE